MHCYDASTILATALSYTSCCAPSFFYRAGRTQKRFSVHPPTHPLDIHTRVCILTPGMHAHIHAHVCTHTCGTVASYGRVIRHITGQISDRVAHVACQPSMLTLYILCPVSGTLFCPGTCQLRSYHSHRMCTTAIKINILEKGFRSYTPYGCNNRKRKE